MPAFEYKALDAKGRSKRGVLEGDNARQIRQRMKEQGLIPLEINETKAKQKAGEKPKLFGQKKISTNELSLLTRQLATLVESGMPLEECLKAVADQSEKQTVKNILVSIRSRVVEGNTLAFSMSEYPQVFDELFCAMVDAGEKSGQLEPILNRLADYVENRQKLRSQMNQAMIYPVMLTVVAISVVSFLLVSVVPQIVDQFVQMGQSLPTSTTILLAMSHFLLNWGLVILALLFIGIIVTKTLLRKPHIRLKWDKALLKLPVIGKVSKGLNTSRFSRTLAICSASAIPLLEGMNVASNVMSNHYFRQALATARDRVREGTSLTNSLKENGLFPPMMLHMIASGEKSGDLEPMLTRAADNQDRDFESTINMALGVFSPLLVVTMAGIVLFIVTATIMPILELNNVISQ